MLQLKNIVKNYTEADHVVRALRDISLQFRKSEFVSILGPSGCGKTTMLNIIGGLDQYTSGDLMINGISTKHYKDRDWDAYRNHSVGFVFQNYHLIPHQSVLANVELALSLSGVGKKERRQRAKEALERVGLGDQLRKKPGQMSGGQMQRVAIARALVNNPDIILADEPTGALDTQTSLQVMEILKEISKERLVIMVTHNPDLAEQYSSRIIRMLDGEITHDSAPLTEEEQMLAVETGVKRKKERLPSMPFHTSFGLSLKNLFTKKGRTILTSFAGSIGIIGIALIFAVSQGMTTYINAVQEETLTAYPLTIEATTVDISALMGAFMGVSEETEETHGLDKVYSQTALADMVNALNGLESTENDLKSFKAYLEQELAKEGSNLKEALSGIQYTYDLDLQVYTENVDGNIIISDTEKLLQDVLKEHMNMDLSAMMGMRDNMMGSMSSSASVGGMKLWCEMLSGKNGELISPLLENQYNVIYGRWPQSFDEIVLVVNENNELEDITLYALGLKSKADIDSQFETMEQGQQIDTTQQSWSYEDICGMQFRAVRSADCYTLDSQTGIYTDLRETDAGLRYLYKQGIDLKVTGILRPNPDVSANMLSGAIGYTKALTEHLNAYTEDSPAVKAQRETPETDIFTGLPFREGTRTEAEKAADFKDHIASLDLRGKAEAYITIMSTPTEEQLEAAVQQTLGGMTRADMEQHLQAMMSQQTGMDEKQINDYVDSMTDEELQTLFAQSVRERVQAQMAAQVQQQMAGLTDAQLAGALTMALPSYTQEDCARYYDVVLQFSDSDYDTNMKELGVVDIDSPATINLYASSFENKEVIEDTIASYNDDVEELKQIRYTDYVGIMMSSITTIIDAITYVLIAFVAISLVVSSIMIGVITLISVQERTKEIGILRAIGASKRNVSSMFNAETVIVGFAAGVLGVGITYLLCIPINAIIHFLTGINNLSAVLPVEVAVILVFISVLLTLISGIIPSRSAAKKDPVVALRTE